MFYSSNYCYTDIEAHKQMIDYGIRKNNLQNYKYILTDKNVGKEEIVVNGYKPGTRLKILGVNDKSIILIVTNKEIKVSDYAAIISKEHDFNYEIAELMEV